MTRISRGFNGKLGLMVIGAASVAMLLPACKPAAPPPPTATPTPDARPKVMADIRSVTAQLEEYKGRTNAYPTTAQGLGVLGQVPKDPWGSDYVYTCPSTRNRLYFDLFSAGADRKPDTPDDDWGEE